jgi:hypothetical protein
MMKQILLLTGLLFFSEYVWAQFTGHYNALNITGSSNTLKSEIPLAEPSVVGSTYLDDDWQHAEIVLRNGNVIVDFPVRVEIEQPNIEINYKGEIKYLNLKELDCVNLIDQGTGKKKVIRKANEFIFNDVPLKGIVVVHTGKQYNAIKHYYIEFLQANYNVALDIGSKDHRKIKKERLYISQDNKLILAKGSSKKIAGQLGLDKEKALTVIKEHKLNLSKETDLITFVGLMQP